MKVEVIIRSNLLFFCAILRGDLQRVTDLPTLQRSEFFSTKNFF